MKPTIFTYGDVEEVMSGNRITLDTVNLTFSVKLDRYQGLAEITQEEADIILSVFNKLK